MEENGNFIPYDKGVLKRLEVLKYMHITKYYTARILINTFKISSDFLTICIQKGIVKKDKKMGFYIWTTSTSPNIKMAEALFNDERNLIRSRKNINKNKNPSVAKLFNQLTKEKEVVVNYESTTKSKIPFILVNISSEGKVSMGIDDFQLLLKKFTSSYE